MRAITEIPAKTPRPIGRTDSFFPGMLKVESAAEVVLGLFDGKLAEGMAVFPAAAEPTVVA